MMTSPRICVFGAGAVGGVIAGRLAKAGRDVSIVARGDHLDAIQSHGLRLVTDGHQEVFSLKAGSDGPKLGPQDLVICTVKAHSLPLCAEELAATAQDAPILFILNGVPWWYFYRGGIAGESNPLSSVDRGSGIWRAIGPQRALGGVIYMTASVSAPGVVNHQGSARLILGEPDNAGSARLDQAIEALQVDELFLEPTNDIRSAVFGKLLNTVSLNQICALTGSPINKVLTDPRTNELVRRLMSECFDVGSALGIDIGVDIDARMEASRNLEFKPSTLQDLEAGKPLEIDALLAAVSELGVKAGTPTPLIDMIFALISRLAEEKGLYARAG